MKRLPLAAGIAVLLAGCGGGDSGPGPTVTSCEVEVQDPSRVPSLEPLDRGRTHRIRFQTSHGAFTVELDPETAPCNGDSLLDLARAGFFDNTRFHRIVPGFVIQGGDPTATGNGGPGYTTIDVPPPDTKYPRNAVAMAKSAYELPGTGGSQFFIVTGDQVELPPDYTRVGTIVEGTDVIQKIGKLGNRRTEVPTERVVIRSAEVSVD